VRLFGLRLGTAIALLNAVERIHPKEPHWYLAVLGTDPEHQGHGIGSAVMTPVLERCDEEGIGAYLESSKERNLAFYGRHGFVAGEPVRLRGAPPLWPMWRDPRPPTSR
jgi:GNAT superfamily N-acetyltransferase